MTFNNSKILLFALSLVSIILLGVLYLGAYGIWTKNKETSKMLALADEVEREAILTQSIRMTKNTAATELEQLDNLVISDSKLASLIEKIEQAGSSFGLNISILSVGKVEDKKAKPVEPHLVRIVMETAGPWAPTLAFLRAIETLPYRVMIEESSIYREEIFWRSKIILSLNSFN
ncbi:MAG: hypothetical protein HYT69_01075 [Candidatus Zambryskibacteria bacterium]|nr:hypothetical protein [Candidatus Zambryskibacteria bacterium]